jgi:hypothetical protein
MLKDSPFSDAKALLVTFSEINIHASGANWVAVPFAAGASSRTCDLKKLETARDRCSRDPSEIRQRFFVSLAPVTDVPRSATPSDGRGGRLWISLPHPCGSYSGGAGQDRTLHGPFGDASNPARYAVPGPNHDSPFDDRRGPNRPVNGEKRPCPSCGEMMRFLEWYEVTHDRVTDSLPAWLCSCGNETFVRPGPFYRRASSEAPPRPPSRSKHPRR